MRYLFIVFLLSVLTANAQSYVIRANDKSKKLTFSFQDGDMFSDSYRDYNGLKNGDTIVLNTVSDELVFLYLNGVKLSGEDLIKQLYPYIKTVKDISNDSQSMDVIFNLKITNCRFKRLKRKFSLR